MQTRITGALSTRPLGRLVLACTGIAAAVSGAMVTAVVGLACSHGACAMSTTALLGMAAMVPSGGAVVGGALLVGSAAPVRHAKLATVALAPATYVLTRIALLVALGWQGP